MKFFSDFLAGEPVFIRLHDTDFEIIIIFFHSLHSIAIYKIFVYFDYNYQWFFNNR